MQAITLGVDLGKGAQELSVSFLTTVCESVINSKLNIKLKY